MYRTPLVAVLALVACGSAGGGSDASPGGAGQAGARNESGGSTSTGAPTDGGLSSSAGVSGALTNGGSANAEASTVGGTGFGTSPAGGGSVTGGAGAAGTIGSASSAGGAAAAAPIVAPAGYKLVWHDEFDVYGPPNPANYKFEQGFVRNEEAQWYQSANASVRDGVLVIEARKESIPNPKYTGSGDWKTTRKTAEYTSSSLNTSGLWSFQYGHFEMRARIPTSAGMWPAWWTLGVSGQWPSNGEIDIMEFYQSKLLANVACGTATVYQAKWDSMTKPLSSLGAGWSSQFHVWTMDWDDQNIVLSVDGQVMNSSSLPGMLNADGSSPFKQKAYLLVNLAVGGINGGDPSATPFPQRYEIDYLRVFQKQ